MSLRKNAESVGDVESAKMFIREELKAARKYCQEGWRHQGSYYKKSIQASQIDFCFSLNL
ncbi:hypothetical protein WI23_11340 [Burkholderia oklahomensis C6786]|nr:hypothetical protein WI23_11340 [Burkholderia oklahomensis C6786]KUY63194.1 hypothetical protein WI23_07460 [Burkholderia oklahomensis C6786]